MSNFRFDTQRLEVTISQSDIDNYVELTGDTNNFHTSNDYANSKTLKGVIVHGMLLASYASRVVGVLFDLDDALMVYESFEFNLPVYVGDTVEMVGTMKRFDKRFGAYHFEIMIVNDESTQVALGKIIMKKAHK